MACPFLENDSINLMKDAILPWLSTLVGAGLGGWLSYLGAKKATRKASAMQKLAEFCELYVDVGKFLDDKDSQHHFASSYVNFFYYGKILEKYDKSLYETIEKILNEFTEWKIHFEKNGENPEDMPDYDNCVNRFQDSVTRLTKLIY